jgi:hypothetical protein
MIDLMGAAVWTDEQITDRTEAILASQISAKRQQILLRVAVGALVSALLGPQLGLPPGQYALSQADIADLLAFAQASGQAQAIADQARADNALLADALAFEAGQLIAPSTQALALAQQRAQHQASAATLPPHRMTE